MRNDETYQSDKHSVEPPQNIRPLVALRSENCHPSHEYRSSFLVEPGRNVLKTRRSIHPAAKQTKQRLIRHGQLTYGESGRSVLPGHRRHSNPLLAAGMLILSNELYVPSPTLRYRRRMLKNVNGQVDDTSNRMSRAKDSPGLRLQRRWLRWSWGKVRRTSTGRYYPSRAPCPTRWNS